MGSSSHAQPVGARDALRVAKLSAERIQAGFAAPDDDWVAVLITVAADGAGQVHGLGGMMGDERSKDELFGVVLPAAIRRANARAFAHVQSSWVQHLGAGGERTGQRQEWLLISAMDRFEHVLLAAPVLRHERLPPRLGAWEDWTARPPGADADYAAGLTGRLVEPLRRALTPQG